MLDMTMQAIGLVAMLMQVGATEQMVVESMLTRRWQMTLLDISALTLLHQA